MYIYITESSTKEKKIEMNSKKIKLANENENDLMHQFFTQFGWKKQNHLTEKGKDIESCRPYSSISSKYHYSFPLIY